MQIKHIYVQQFTLEYWHQLRPAVLEWQPWNDSLLCTTYFLYFFQCKNSLFKNTSQLLTLLLLLPISL